MYYLSRNPYSLSISTMYDILKHSRNFGYKNGTRGCSHMIAAIKYRAQSKARQGWNDAVGNEASCLSLEACKLAFCLFVCFGFCFVKVLWSLGLLSDSLLSLDGWAASQKYLLTSLALWGVSSLPPTEATISSAFVTWWLCYCSLLLLKPTVRNVPAPDAAGGHLPHACLRSL